MAHSTLHFTIGALVGSGLALPTLCRAWFAKRPWSFAFKRWFVWSAVWGTVAVLPGLLRRLGVPDAICDGPWMNICLLYPWINSVKPGGETMGPLMLGAFLGCQYLALVAALAWMQRRSARQHNT
ncbi:MAG: hypothetical protein O3A51_11870 [Verrucomicrobia bacterium]|nr:hypothetical protein [Verrucomicrobiota bacterium]